MTRLAILTEDEQTAFDYPPVLPANVKAICFATSFVIKYGKCKYGIINTGNTHFTKM